MCDKHELTEEEQRKGLKQAVKGIKNSKQLSKKQKENLLKGVKKAKKNV